MRKSKQFICAVFCFAFLFAKSSFANFPAFDPMSFIPDLKQFKELAADLRNTKEQLNQIRQDLRAMGDSIRSVASYSQAIIHTVKRGVDAASKAVDTINQTLGTNIEIGNGLNNIISSAENLQKTFVEDTVNKVDSALKGEKLDEVLAVANDKKEELEQKARDKVNEEVDRVSDSISEAANTMAEGISEATEGIREDIGTARDKINTQVDNAKGKINETKRKIKIIEDVAGDTRDVINNTRDRIENAKDEIHNIGDVNGYIDGMGERVFNKTEDIENNIKEGVARSVEKGLENISYTNRNSTTNTGNTLSQPRASTTTDGSSSRTINTPTSTSQSSGRTGAFGITNKNLPGGRVAPLKNQPIVFEEEEEEEEISNEESIAVLKKYFTTIYDENKKIANRLNDVLDMHINKLNTSSENAEKSLTQLESDITNNSIFTSEEKEDLVNRILDIKSRHQKVYDWNIILAEKAKDKYNIEFKNKILDNLSNYEKMAIAYLNGDATLKEVNKVGEQVKKNAKTMSVATDRKVMEQIKKEAAKLRKDLAALSDDIKKKENKSKVNS